jgi:replicative DNA helicase
MNELERLGINNLLTCQKPALTIEQVEHYARLAKARFGEIGVLGIDYLGLMAADGANSEYERISYCAEQSKVMAKRLNLPVVILTQINRASARDGEIETWSAKGSGAVEASADYMLGIQRNQQKEIIVKILKNRSGEANLQFRADLDAKYLKFRSLEPYNAICSKNVSRGKERKSHRLKEAAYADYDPFSGG